MQKSSHALQIDCHFQVTMNLDLVFYQKKYPDVADTIFNFEIRPDDVCLVAFPKSGSTYLSNIVWQSDFSAPYLPPDHNYLELIS